MRTVTMEQVQAFRGTREQAIEAGLGAFVMPCRCAKSSKAVRRTLADGEVINDRMCVTCVAQLTALGDHIELVGA